MKKESIKIETPEKIIFTYRIAGVGTRIAAFTVDLVIQGVALLLIAVLILAVNYSAFSVSGILETGEGGMLVYAFYFIILFFLQWGYFLLFEILMNGQSPGKALMRIRVIRETGQPLDFATLAMRNLLRAVDGFPFYNLVGGFTAILDKHARRLGDIVSGTLVVNDIRFNLKEPDFTTILSTGQKAAAAKYLQKSGIKLTENELMIIRRFLNEKEKLPLAKQEELALKLAVQVMARLQIQEQPQDALAFLEMVYREHTHAYDQ